jgi:predicted HicB family RNase H-like nuclease
MSDPKKTWDYNQRCEDCGWSADGYTTNSEGVDSHWCVEHGWKKSGYQPLIDVTGLSVAESVKIRVQEEEKVVKITFVDALHEAWPPSNIKVILTKNEAQTLADYLQAAVAGTPQSFRDVQEVTQDLLANREIMEEYNSKRNYRHENK